MSDPKQTRPVKPITQKRLMNIALYYLGRYESSAEKLRQLLKRRVAKAKMKGADIPVDILLWIDSIVLKMCQDGYISDERFASGLVSKYRAAGKSKRYIASKLHQAGIDADTQEKALAGDEDVSDEDPEMEAARRLVKKKKLGFWRNPEVRIEYRKKDLAVLARAGFSFDVATKALGEFDGTEEDEYV